MKGKNGNITVEQPVGHHINQVIKISISCNGTKPQHAHVEICIEKHPVGEFMSENPAKDA